MIEKLTKAQEETIVPFREKWIDRILRTEKTDDEIKQGVKNLYKMCGLKEPVVYIMDSPLGSQIMVKFLRELKPEQLKSLSLEGSNIESNIESNIWSNIGSNIESNIWSNIRNNIRSNIESNIGNNIRSNIESNIGNNIWSNIGSNIESNIGNNIRSNIGSNIESNIWSNIRNNIRSNIESNIGNNIGNNIESNIGNNIGNNIENIEAFSCNDSSWIHWYLYQLYYFEVNLLKEDEYSKLLRTYINDVIDTWMCIYLDNVAIVSRKPVVRREEEMLSSDHLPAVLFKDGCEIYFLDGVELPKEMWGRIISKEMSLSEIMKIEISDQRTVALKYNPQAIIKEKAKLINKDERTNELYLVEGSEINTLTNFPKMYFLKMTCPTGRIFIEGVPPEIAESNLNATECQAYLCGLTKSEYMEMKMES